jgi:hypothetical protein
MFLPDDAPIPAWQEDDAFFRRLRRTQLIKDRRIFYGAMRARGGWWEIVANPVAVLARRVSKPDQRFERGMEEAGRAWGVMYALLEAVPPTVGIVDAAAIESLARHTPRKATKDSLPCMRLRAPRKTERQVDPRIVEIVARSVDQEDAAAYWWVDSDNKVRAMHGLAMRTATFAGFAVGQEHGEKRAPCTDTGIVLPLNSIRFP